MTSSLFFRMLIIAAGICLLLITFYMYSKRKLTDGIALGWAVFSVIMIMAGAIRAWSGWSKALALASYPMVFSMGGLLVLIIFRHSIYLSLMIMKNQELAMHVSILSQENEEIIEKLAQLQEQQERLIQSETQPTGWNRDAESETK